MSLEKNDGEIFCENELATLKQKLRDIVGNIFQIQTFHYAIEICQCSRHLACIKDTTH